MWSYRLVAPYVFERSDLRAPSPDALTDGQVLLSFSAAGICGSDIPGFRGTQGKLPGDTGASAAQMPGFPIHEIAGEVLASRHPDHRVGDHVVGWASGFDGLMEQVIADGDGLVSYDPALPPRLAVGLQPLACVLCAVEQLPDLDGRHVAVIGQGSIGLLFSYVAKALGAARVTGVDPPRPFRHRRALRHRHPGARHERPLGHAPGPGRPGRRGDRAVGHQVATLNHALTAAAFGGTVFYFGVPDDDSYPISMRTMLRNNLTLKSGVTTDRQRVLRRADTFAREHPHLLPGYVTHTFGVDDVQAAFELACRPVPDRVKIVVAR